MNEEWWRKNEGWWRMNDDDFKLLRGFTDRPMDKRTDICECRRKERKKISTLDNSFKPIFYPIWQDCSPPLHWIKLWYLCKKNFLVFEFFQPLFFRIVASFTVEIDSMKKNFQFPLQVSFLDLPQRMISWSLQPDVFCAFSLKTWSNETPNYSLGFCSSRGFQNNSYIRLVSLLNSIIATEKNILWPTTDFVSTVISVNRGAKKPKSKENWASKMQSKTS